MDVSEAGLDSPTEADLEVPSSLGMTARAKAPGPYIPSGPIVYQSDIRTIVPFLRWGLGGYAFTAGATGADPDGAGPLGAPLTEYNTHEVWANDLRYFEPFCARIGKDEYEHGFAGCVVAGIEVSVEREFVPFTVNTQATKDFRAPLKDIEDDIFPGLPEEFALPYHSVSLFIDEEDAVTPIDVSHLAMNLEMGFDNNIDSERGVTLGSRYARRHGSSGRSFTLSSEMHFENLDQREAFWGDVNGPSDRGSKTFPVRVKIDSGAAFADGNYGSAEIVFPRCFFSAVPHTTSGREEMSQAVAMMVQTGKVTLDDGTTEVATAMYAKIKNRAGDVSLPGNP